MNLVVPNDGTVQWTVGSPCVRIDRGVTLRIIDQLEHDPATQTSVEGTFVPASRERAWF
jgi:hypothetical protein